MWPGVAITFASILPILNVAPSVKQLIERRNVDVHHIGGVEQRAERRRTTVMPVPIPVLPPSFSFSQTEAVR